MKILGYELKVKHIIENPGHDELRFLAADGEITTVFGTPSYVTQVRNRIAEATRIADTDIARPEYLPIVKEVLEYLKDKTLIQVDRTMCRNTDFSLACRLYVTKKYARIPLMWGETLFPPIHDREPDLVTITIPEWHEKQVLVFPEDGLTLILGSDYKGENKKSMLRHSMYRAKKLGWLGLHAGSKILRVKRNGSLADMGFLFFGLSGTGKTTLSCHSHWLRGEEKVSIRQDDVVLLRRDSSALGTEESFYIKTDKMSAQDQPLLYAALISPRAILENVMTNKETGEIDFHDTTLTSNGRAVVKRGDIAYTDDSIDLPRTDCIVFITRRNDIIPPIARLNSEQAAAAFMLGESIETSAGDPSQAGKSKRVVGTNPFIVGPPHEEGNRFLEILRENPHIECFLMNTGRVGAKDDFKGENITLKISARLIELVARGEIRWRIDSCWGYEVPEEIPGLNMDVYDPQHYYQQDEYDALCEKLKSERLEWLEQFAGLEADIIGTLLRK